MDSTDHDASLRSHLLELLDGGAAHPGFEDLVPDLPAAWRGARPDGSRHTPWRLLEHLRIAQWDIVEFSRDPAHVSPAFPDGYWPERDVPPSDDAWDASVEAFRSDLEAMRQLVREAPDLHAPIPHGDGQTLLREALLVADHNAWHLGQFALIRRRLESDST